MNIIIKIFLIETHYYNNIIKHYHGYLWQIYFLIITKIPSIELNLVLPMFLNAMNKFLDPNDLVLTLLVFGVYFRIIELNISSPYIT